MSLPLLLIIVVVAVALASFGLWQSSRSPARTRETSRNLTRNPSIFDMEIGDIIQYAGQDWVVEGRLVYTEDGFSWLEYMLQDGDDIAWLSVEEDDWVTVALSFPVTNLEVSDSPPPELAYGGSVYRCTDSGMATMRREGNLRRPEAESCRYFDYEGDNKQVLSVENWGGDLEVTAGTIIPPSSLTILPGGGDSVYRTE